MMSLPLPPSIACIPKVHTMRERADLTYRILAERLDTVLPLAMDDGDLDMWIVLCQEDDLDPIHETMIPLDCWCPILQMLVFIRTPDGIRRVSICGTNTKDLYERPYTGQVEDEQWKVLQSLVREADPGRIGVNIGSVMVRRRLRTTFTQLRERLPEGYADRLSRPRQPHEVAAPSPMQIDLFGARRRGPSHSGTALQLMPSSPRSRQRPT